MLLHCLLRPLRFRLKRPKPVSLPAPGCRAPPLLQWARLDARAELVSARTHGRADDASAASRRSSCLSAKPVGESVVVVERCLSLPLLRHADLQLPELKLAQRSADHAVEQVHDDSFALVLLPQHEMA